MQGETIKTTEDRIDNRALRGAVVQYTDPDCEPPAQHESVTRTKIAAKLATLKGYEFAGDYDPARHYTYDNSRSVDRDCRR